MSLTELVAAVPGGDVKAAAIIEEKRGWGGRRPGAGKRKKESAQAISIANAREHAAKRVRKSRQRRALGEQHAELANKRGRTWNYDVGRLLLELVLGFMYYYNYSITTAVDTVSQLTHTARDGLFRLYTAWTSSHEIYVHESFRGGAAPIHINHSGVTMELCQKTISHAHKFINTFMEDDQKFCGSIDNIISSPPTGAVDIDSDIWNDMENNNVDVDGVLITDEDERY